MKRNDLGKYIFSVIFLGVCFIYGSLCITKAYPKIISHLQENSIMNFSGNKENINKLQEIINENTAYRYDLIEAYGYINQALGKNEINGFEYVKDKEGYLNSGNFWSNIHTIESDHLAVRVKKLNDDMEERGTKTMVLGFPEKFENDSFRNYSGIPYNSHSYVVDEYLAYIRKYRVPYIDFRRTLAESDLSYEEKFYKTDHHWTPRAAFESFKELINVLNEKFEMNLDPDGYYRNSENYIFEKFEDMMLGSSGRSAGISYSDIEDFELIYPKDENEYELYLNSGDEKWTYRGNYQEVLLNYDAIDMINNDREKLYTNSLYDMYLHGIKVETKITNKSNRDGLKVLFLRDSYSDPLAAFMAPLCGQIDMLWTERYSGDIDEYVKNGDYDLVIVGFYPDDIKESFFKFYED